MIGPSPDARNDVRPGEISVEAPLSYAAGLHFVGRIATPWRIRSDCPRQGDRTAGPLCRLELDPIWEPALDGVRRHDELQILYWMHEARRDLVRLAPRSASRGRGNGEDARGPFALRAPTRPNPIASSIVALIARDGPTLIVRGLDCIDGTPLLDIKPWRDPY